MSTLAEISVPTDESPPTEVDILIVGAGPAGLYGAYYAGFRGLRVAVMDVLPQPGGQITAMYPEKPIFEIAGLPSVRGRDLIDNLLAQAAPYGPEYLLGHQAVDLSYDDGRPVVRSAQGATVRAGAVIVTGGIRDGRTLVEHDAALRAWEFYAPLAHPVAGIFLHEGLPARLTRTPGSVHTPAPRLGEHTAELLTGLLGLDESEQEALRAAAVLE